MSPRPPERPSLPFEARSLGNGARHGDGAINPHSHLNPSPLPSAEDPVSGEEDPDWDSRGGPVTFKFRVRSGHWRRSRDFQVPSPFWTLALNCTCTPGHAAVLENLG